MTATPPLTPADPPVPAAPGLRHAAILSTGDEVVLGQIQDTNARWIAQRLVELGVAPVEHGAVADDLEALTAALLRLARTADLIIMSGGLGPTEGDLTRAALARVLREPLVVDERAKAALTAMLQQRGREASARQLRQAERPASALCLANSVGTAPGLQVTIPAAISGAAHATTVICLPGPPGELRPMWDASVAPWLRTRSGGVLLTRLIHVVALPEAEVAERLKDLTTRAPSPGTPLVGMTASGGVITVRIRLSSPRQTPAAAAPVDALEMLIRARLGDHALNRTLAEAALPALAESVLADLAARSETLAVCESCTGGLLGSILTSVPGASDAFGGGLITYSNESKSALAGVDPAEIAGHGAVSATVARAMAHGARARLGTTFALAITGIAGPGGGSTAKPVGTVVLALDSSAACALAFLRIPGERADVRSRAAAGALALLHFALRENSASPRPPLLWERSDL
ncbi:competence/damage-inducible protein A [soil metagenome]